MTRERVDPLHGLSQTLGEHYQKKQAFYAFKPPKTYDRDLSRLFSADPRHRREQPASVFIRRHRAQIRQLVARWTGENQLTLDAVLDNMIWRCRELDLRAPAPTEARDQLHHPANRQTMQALFGPSAAQMDRAMRRLRILVLMHPDCVPPDSTDGYTAREINGWKTEFERRNTCVRPATTFDRSRAGGNQPLRDEIESFKPQVVYTLLEEFHYATLMTSTSRLSRADENPLYRM